MPDASTAVQEALTEALSSPDAESQAASESGTEVTRAIAEAIKSPVAATSEPKTSESTDKGKTVPYDRFSEVVKQKNEVSERYKSLENQFTGVTKREETLRDRVAELETDHQILDAIKSLSRNPKYSDHVMAIDRALQGIEEEVVVAEKTGNMAAVSDAEKRLAAKTSELENLVAEQKTEALWNAADSLASNMLKALPEEYTEDDKAVIGKLWTPRVDWDGIEANGRDSIPQALQSSFAAVIKEYGPPRGALINQTTKSVESRIPEALRVSSEDSVKSILSKDWAKIDDKGVPVLSDEDFQGSLAELMRRTRG